jgi:hypothetical protein
MMMKKVRSTGFRETCIAAAFRDYKLLLKA